LPSGLETKTCSSIRGVEDLSEAQVGMIPTRQSLVFNMTPYAGSGRQAI